jgi:hypothetical protein
MEPFLGHKMCGERIRIWKLPFPKYVPFLPPSIHVAKENTTKLLAPGAIFGRWPWGPKFLLSIASILFGFLAADHPFPLSTTLYDCFCWLTDGGISFCLCPTCLLAPPFSLRRFMVLPLGSVFAASLPLCASPPYFSSPHRIGRTDRRRRI